MESKNLIDRKVKMPGLRERQRKARRQNILFAARELFNAKRFDQVNLEEVAAAAEVSVPTIYTFFESKQDILLGLLEVDRYLQEPRLAEVVVNLPSDPAEALYKIAHAILAEDDVIRPKRVWREILAASMRPASGQSNQLDNLLAVSSKYTAQTIKILRDSGSLSRDVDFDSAVRVVRGQIRIAFRNYILDEAMTMEKTMEMLSDDLKIIIAGLK